MSFVELFFLAVGVSMDAFAVAVCAGLAMPKIVVKKALIIGIYFGVFQAVMPLIGYAAAALFADKITSFDHWIAFALLCFLGGKMIYGSFGNRGCTDRECPVGICEDRTCPGGAKPGNSYISAKPAQMLPLALATSIDALAVGVSFAFLRISIIPAISFIGITTLLISLAGVKIGNAFGARFKQKAELAGGVILILIGLKILLDHFNAS